MPKRIDQRRNRRRPRNGSPAVLLPLGVQRQVNPYRYVGVLFQDFGAFREPGAGRHDGHRHRDAGFQHGFRRQVHRMAHTDIVAADKDGNGGIRMRGLRPG